MKKEIMIIMSVLIIIAVTGAFYFTSAFIFSTFDISKWNTEFKGFVGLFNLIICCFFVALYINTSNHA